ncbi:MAG: polyprenyl synthetase family protein [Solirubrobacterales bacterium]
MTQAVPGAGPRDDRAPSAVSEVMDRAEAWLPQGLRAVEERLRDAASGYGAVLEAEAGATLEAGGKRLRPTLVLVCAGPSAGEAAIRAATAVELMHMATLVHDDVVDAAPLRRGRPTVVARSGRAAAVATGDLLFSQALAGLAEGGRREEVDALTGASVALALGELTQRADAWRSDVTVERYERRCQLKTGALFASATRLGALAAGGAGADEVAAFGSDIGVAFQLLDDVLDVIGPPERTGKAIGTDLLDGTATLPLILAARQDPELAALDMRTLDQRAAEAVCRRIAATGALEETRARAMALVASAKDQLEEAGLPAERRELLELVADGTVERYS